jgi:hypothetical protein
MEMVWDNSTVPKHALIQWLAIKDRLSTWDRLAA